MLVSLVACRVVATFSVSSRQPQVQNSMQLPCPPLCCVRALAASPPMLLVKARAVLALGLITEAM